MKTIFSYSQSFKTSLICILYFCFLGSNIAIADEDLPTHAVSTSQQVQELKENTKHTMHSVDELEHSAQTMDHKQHISDTEIPTSQQNNTQVKIVPDSPSHDSMHNMDSMSTTDKINKTEATNDMAMPMGEGGHSAEDHAQMIESQPSPEELVASVGFDDKTGQTVSLTTLFLTEEGKEVQIGDLITGPTIILPIFFYCPVVCPLLLSSLAEGVAQIPYKEGIDYHIIALSFNDIETPNVAKNAKNNYLHLLPKDFDKSSWNFLTGSEKNILTFTQSIGFRFKKTSPNNFVHPNGLVVVDENGTIIRYIYGSTFLGADMGMAISEAQRNTPGTSIKRLLSICFNYDSEGKEYIAITFKVLATLTIVGLGLFFVFFLRRTRSGTNRSQRPNRLHHHSDKKSTPQDEKK